jgi:hypothetical protein
LIFNRPDEHKISRLKPHPNVALHFNTDEKAEEDEIVFLGPGANRFGCVTRA